MVEHQWPHWLYSSILGMTSLLGSEQLSFNGHLRPSLLHVCNGTFVALSVILTHSISPVNHESHDVKEIPNFGRHY